MLYDMHVASVYSSFDSMIKHLADNTQDSRTNIEDIMVNDLNSSHLNDTCHLAE